METTPKIWLTFSELERATGTPGNTLRRWADSFREFLPCRVEGRVRRFHPESVPTFKRIAGLFQEGKQSREVIAILAKETPAVHDVAPASLPVQTEGLTGALPALVQAEIGRALGESLAVIADQRKRLDAQEEELARLRQIQAGQAEELVKLREVISSESAPKGFWARLLGR